ncbi:hypothetical protein [Hydrogenophaga sp.]|jgi:hypothetical protein|uniref:hypothetical protein n=1 Tax=Hydrogenophaga sp. TaxID=1904254 RepID=UPI002723E1C1|nr:hypothetical protein [Hydrogenophaga sp.]MDO9249976.1 hypothetical protein [Hydrogenophaga sp.]MDP3324422.1 hypothetical protein [Hydrogenophaga sp.]MDP3883480.1 hypothetical protein [Hydrogenophaga sp.]MDZ4173141.1 hypothetical protein [Hydrogenophaga sp.]
MLEIAFIALFCITIIIAPIAWLRMLAAKSQRFYLVNVAIFVLPIVVVFGLGHLAGFVDFSAPLKDEPPANLSVPQLSWIQVLLLSAAGCLWLIGGNVLMYRHTKRMGRSYWSILNPFKPQFRDFTAREWASLVVLVAVTLLLAALAMNLVPQ